MSDEESAKKMEFILEQQAQFAAKIGQLEDILTRLANSSLNRFEDGESKITALIDSQIRLTEAQDRLTEAQARTDESVKNLIAVADRYFNEKRNGKP